MIQEEGRQSIKGTIVVTQAGRKEVSIKVLGERMGLRCPGNWKEHGATGERGQS